jgi:hypothetical protein
MTFLLLLALQGLMVHRLVPAWTLRIAVAIHEQVGRSDVAMLLDTTN